jgi:hypothetical protein
MREREIIKISNERFNLLLRSIEFYNGTVVPSSAAAAAAKEILSLRIHTCRRGAEQR